MFDSVTTEEELQRELGLTDTDGDTADQDGNVQNIAEEHPSDSEEQDDVVVNSDFEEKSMAVSERVLRTNKNRQDARYGQKRQADEFLQNTQKRQKLDDLNVGDNLLIPVPDVDRGPADSRNVLDVILDVKYGKYRFGTANGVLLGYYAYNRISKAPGSASLFQENIPDEAPKLLREVARLQSITGGQGMLRCDCKGGCKTKRCKCKQAKVLCNSRCHHSATCINK